MSARVAALFLAALLGVLAAVGVVVATLGALALVAYLAVVIALLTALVRRARALLRQQQEATAGRTCTCCTSTVFDPVEVR